MSRVDVSCSCIVSVSLMLNSEDSDICDNWNFLTKTGVGSSSTGGFIMVEIGSRERKSVYMSHR